MQREGCEWCAVGGIDPAVANGVFMCFQTAVEEGDEVKVVGFEGDVELFEDLSVFCDKLVWVEVGAVGVGAIRVKFFEEVCEVVVFAINTKILIAFVG